MERHTIYIIKSKKTERFYIGETRDLAQRLIFHNNPELNTNSTKGGIPWELFFSFEVQSRSIALKIEKHIKSMKSKKYLIDLKKYPEMKQKLIKRFE